MDPNSSFTKLPPFDILNSPIHEVTLMRREDRELFVGNAEGGKAGKKGKKALDSLEKNFQNSNISELVIKRNGIPISDRNAKEHLEELRKKD